jgi:hypothetical protein
MEDADNARLAARPDGKKIIVVSSASAATASSTTTAPNAAQQRAADAADAELDVGELYHQAQQLFHELDALASLHVDFLPKVRRGLGMFAKCLLRIDAAGVLSANETVRDMKTTDLRYLLCPFYLAELHLKLPGREQRLKRVEQATQYMQHFLQACDKADAMDDAQATAYRRDESDVVTAEVQRAEKVAAFKKGKATASRLAVLLEKRDARTKRGATDDDAEEDDVEREFALLLLEQSCGKAADQLRFGKQELQILTSMAAAAADPAVAKAHAEEKQRAEAKLKPYLIHMPDGNTQNKVDLRDRKAVDAHIQQRTNARRQVFKEANPATMTLDELVDYEIANGIINLDVNAPHKHVDPNRIVRREFANNEASDDDDHDPENEAEDDAATLKARDWAVYTDANERGAGNKHKNW